MAGGAPGGSVRMLLTGALTVGKDSSVESNGLAPQVTTTLACAMGAFRVGCEARKPEVSLVGGGGGGGGSVWIDALSILGDGQITANGGSVIKIRISIAGTLTEVASPGGAGGGGRVALYYRDQLAPTIVARAAGGRSQEFTAYGTAGFVYLKNMRTFAEELVLDNNYDQQQVPWPPTTLPASAFAALTLRGGAIARARTVLLNVTLLTMSAKAQLRAASAFGDLVIRSDEVKLSDGARVAAGVVDISAQRIDITGMTTEVTAAGTASGSPADGASTGFGGGGGGGPQAPGGGCMTVAAGAQSTNGKGGRGGSVMTNLGGNGGGIVRLNAWNQLTFAMSPTVAVSGFPATSAGVFGAGGGGAGTIEVIADKIAGAARFLADGGSTKGTGGGGSGGFVLLKSAKLTTLPPSITVVVTGGANEEIPECKGNDGQISHDAMVVNRKQPFCRAGATFGDGGCVPCPRGSSTYGEIDASTCDLCQPGMYAPVEGTPSCLECEPGSASSGTGQARCEPCETGTFASQFGARQCSVCGVDRQANATGKASCDQCGEGTFSACSVVACPTTFCRWRPDFMDCGTVTCAECVKGDLRADCARWNKFSARKSILTGAALSCRCAVAKEEVEVTLQARSGLGDVWTSGGVDATLTFGGGALAPISPVVRANGSFVFSFAFPAEGNYTITVNANGIDVGESPVTIQVGRVTTSVPANLTAAVTTDAEDGVPGWAIGVAVGGALALLLGGLGVFFLLKRRRAQQAPAKMSAAAEMKPQPQSITVPTKAAPPKRAQSNYDAVPVLANNYDVVPADSNYDVVVPATNSRNYGDGNLDLSDES
jgi:hypothetical protein